jgi:hypothetical protein
VQDITFVNYGATSLITGCNMCNSGQFMRQGGFTYRTEGLKFVNSTYKLVWSPHYKEIFLDLDGTLGGGQPHSWLIKSNEFNSWPECIQLPSTEFQNTMLCDNTTTVRRLQIDTFTPEILAFTGMLLLIHKIVQKESS